MPELTPKQARFVDEYMLDLNGTKAAVRAGFSEKSAQDIAAQLLGKTHVREAIEQAKAERSKKTNIDAAWLLKRLADEASADINDIYGPDGELLPVKDWPMIWRQGLIVGIETEEIRVEGVTMGIIRKVKQSDRLRRLELIGKHVNVNAFQDVVQHKGLEGLADRIARAKNRK